jgi:phytoene dehydrogenase-like protein
VSTDVIVIGAGHNGMVAALRLAGAGRRVTVLERREVTGGLAAAEEFSPGYRSPGVLHDTAGLRPRIAAALGLERHGLSWRQRPPFVAARAGREPLRSDAAGNGLAAWRRSVDELRPFVSRLLERPPPRLELRGAGDILRLGLEGLALRRLGRRRSRELLRVLPMSAEDWLSDWFDDADVAGAVAAPGLLGVFAGPRSPGTAGGLLMHESGAGREVAGGPAALAAALESAARAAGVEVRTGAEVTAIDVGNGRARGVSLASGEQLPAAAVAASCDPKTALLRLLPPGNLGLRDERAIGLYRSRGTVAKLHLALSGPPVLAGDGGEPPELMRIGSLNELERAFDDLKYGRLPEAPALEVRLPSLADPELAPAGHHVASVLVSCVPHTPDGGWQVETRQRLERAVMDRLEEAAPGLGELVVDRQLSTPADIEQRYGSMGGHLFHGEMALDQLLSMRPAICAGRYRTPIEGLYLAGGGSHPGGGISGLPGWLAASTILADR